MVKFWSTCLFYKKGTKSSGPLPVYQNTSLASSWSRRIFLKSTWSTLAHPLLRFVNCTEACCLYPGFPSSLHLTHFFHLWHWGDFRRHGAHDAQSPVEAKNIPGEKTDVAWTGNEWIPATLWVSKQKTNSTIGQRINILDSRSPYFPRLCGSSTISISLEHRLREDGSFWQC